MINTNGNIKEKCLIMFRIGDKEMTEWFHVTNTGDQNLILGLPWLTKRNPIIDWRRKSLEIHTSTGDSNWRKSEVTAKIRGPQGKPEVNNSWPAMNEDLVVRYLSRNGSPSPWITEMVWDGDDLDCMQWKEETFNDTVEIGKFTMAQKIDQKYRKPEEEVRLPPEYVEYSSVFEKEASERFPERRHWDHAIELRDDFVPKKG